ncbi:MULTISPECIES: hypothetical protein [unclassified Neisseria]|uniref:hypothetical protein n=1 Tax=unclassified Neisseria TaxID=2623750 RepID=UPI00266701AE|nr:MULTISPECIES: hypothetical protein [unclassified Neisseria]MDO1510733.1 hypothetical protein [Neisseria sp. MVDL19-042950]MDO1517023.1 hypothetical protein [Neisseria sp. MVDL18-041461]MDO1564385.1 hypothetical protein [Neisseria sp. MVDL20-010259]
MMNPLCSKPNRFTPAQANPNRRAGIPARLSLPTMPNGGQGCPPYAGRLKTCRQAFQTASVSVCTNIWIPCRLTNADDAPALFQTEPFQTNQANPNRRAGIPARLSSQQCLTAGRDARPTREEAV